MNRIFFKLYKTKQFMKLIVAFKIYLSNAVFPSSSTLFYGLKKIPRKNLTSLAIKHEKKKEIAIRKE